MLLPVSVGQVDGLVEASVDGKEACDGWMGKADEIYNDCAV